MGEKLTLDFDRKLKKHEQLLLPVLEIALSKLELKLYDFDYQQGSSTFRVFVFNSSTNTATLEECIKLDRELSSFFDNEELPENIRLEVSSPGLYRFLRKLKHFEMSVGENIKVQLINKLEEIKSKTVEGVLVNVESDGIEINLNKYNKKLHILFSSIKSANAEYVF